MGLGDRGVHGARGCLWAQGGAVHAQEKGNTEIKVTAYTDVGPNGPSLGEITVGRPVTIAIEVAHPPNTQIVFPRIENQWDDVFELRGSPQVSSEEKDGRLVTTKTFEVVAFRPGEHETPPLIVTVLSAGEPTTRPVGRDSSTSTSSQCGRRTTRSWWTSGPRRR